MLTSNHLSTDLSVIFQEALRREQKSIDKLFQRSFRNEDNFESVLLPLYRKKIAVDTDESLVGFKGSY